MAGGVMLDMDRLTEVQQRTLQAGAHADAQDGMCVMEAVAYVAGEPWSDHPACACPVISAFLRAWNDGLPDDATRTRLLAPLIPRLVGSRSTPAVEVQRSYLALDWLVRVNMPAWLALVPSLQPHAAALRALPEIADAESAKAAQAAVAAARDAVTPAARAAASNAAGGAARDGAWGRLSAAASNATWAAATAAAWAAAWAAARASAMAGASNAARDAAWDAATAAAGAALAPTVATLQQSALELVDRMLACGAEAAER